MDIAEGNALAIIAFSLVMILALLTYVFLFRESGVKKLLRGKRVMRLLLETPEGKILPLIRQHVQSIHHNL